VAAWVTPVSGDGGDPDAQRGDRGVGAGVLLARWELRGAVVTGCRRG
jgi:hypothetical protein